MRKVRRRDALDYHSNGRPGKIEVVATKALNSQLDLSLAYSPGVAEPCLAIKDDPTEAFKYTARGNLVAVITNGTAVLGLGNIGPLAAKPVMEGKGVLFKKFADIDVFDLELDAEDPDRFIECVAALEPTFGGINLEDIKAPESFYIEEQLRQRMNIPVFHDDQHGTAIISGAALLNAAVLQEKKLADLRIAVSGAGASAVACARFFISLGVQPHNVVMCDSTGVIYKGRTERMNSAKEAMAVETEARTLADAVEGADVFLGLSTGGVLSREMVATMAERAIVFALANPDPEIPYDEAKAERPDAIVATGRSDTNNQVNNVLGFPFIFRGALDVSATTVTEDMKVAAAKALAELARRDVPQVVSLAYGRDYEFGPDYIIPKPFDPRVLHWVAPAVAEAAVASGVATRPYDAAAYREHLKGLLGQSTAVMRRFLKQASSEPKRIAFPEATKPPVLQAVSVLVNEGIAVPVLIGDPKAIAAVVEEHEIDLAIESIEIVNPAADEKSAEYHAKLYAKRQRRGEGRRATRGRLQSPLDYGLMMVDDGRVDGIVAGHDIHYPDALRPALQILGPAKHAKRVAGMYMILHKRGTLFFGDTTVNVETSAEDLADIAEMVADAAVTFDEKPRIAMLSMSNFGSVNHPQARKIARATAMLQARRPDLAVEGEIQANYAVNYELQQRSFPFSTLDGPANVLIFPNLDAGNVAYKLLRELGGITAVGPVLLGMANPVTVLERDCDVDNIVLMTALTVVQAQDAARRKRDGLDLAESAE